MEKATVSIVRCCNYDFEKVKKAVKESIDLVGGINSFVEKGDDVLIKVNALAPFKPEDAVTTHPAVVKAVIQLVKKVGGNPIVGDFGGVGGEMSTKEILDKCGIAAVCIEEEARLIGFETTGFSKVKVNGKKVKETYVASPLLEVDKVISLPKLKTHTEGIFTGAIKNSFGFTPFKIRQLAHMYSFREISGYFVDFYSVRKPDLVVTDAVVGMEGNGPVRGYKKKVGLILSSADGVAIDAVASDIVGLKNVYAIDMAAKEGLGEGNLNKIKIVGEKLEKVRVEFVKPTTITSKVPRFIRYLFISVLISKLVVDESRCTKCMACVEYCPSNAILFKNFPKIVKEKCILCYGCKFICPENAIYIKKNPIKSALQGVRRIIRL